MRMWGTDRYAIVIYYVMILLSCSLFFSYFSIPMLDLLVNLAASSRLNPSAYTIVLLSEKTGKPKDYKPNQTIGSLCVQSSGSDNRGKHATLELKSKKLEKKSSGKQAQPFEVMFYFYTPVYSY